LLLRVDAVDLELDVVRERDAARFGLARDELDRVEPPLLRFALEDVDLVVAISAIPCSFEDVPSAGLPSVQGN
jgi:hypothetical protein